MYISKSVHSSIESFSKITLEEMNNVKLMDRVETKFVLSARQLPQVLQQLLPNYNIVNIEDNLIPTYKTVYFDTDALHFYSEHHRKRKNRYKVRYRNYVDSSLTFLEVKHKQNGRVDKQRIKVDDEHLYLNDDEKAFLRDANIQQTNLRRKLTNYYKRITLVSKHSVERVTFDMNISFRNETHETGLDDIVIAELKQPKVSRTTPVYHVLRNNQIKPYSVSKYCVGIIKTMGAENVKHNRFKKKLLQLNKINTL